VTPDGPNAAALRADERRERWTLLGLSGPALALVLVTMVLPIGWLFGLSFLADDGSLSLMHYRRMIEQPSYARIFGATFKVSLMTTALCVVLGYPLAYVMSQLPRRAASLCLIAVMLPFWTSLLVRTYAWLVLLQRRGLVNTWGMELGLWDEPLALVHNLAGSGEQVVAHWRAQLDAALGGNARVVIDVIADVELLTGPLQPVAVLGPVESRNRFNTVFRDFVRLFATAAHPLVILLDDLQWADAASL
jgi:ABC-type sugar transport system permease subunit